MTIGAGTAEGDTSATCSGTLTKGINRNRDVDADPIVSKNCPFTPSKKFDSSTTCTCISQDTKTIWSTPACPK